MPLPNGRHNSPQRSTVGSPQCLGTVLWAPTAPCQQPTFHLLSYLPPGRGRGVKVQALATCPIAGVCRCQAYQASSTRQVQLGPSRLVEAYPLRPVSTVHYSRPLHCSLVLSRSRFRMHAGIMRKPNRPRWCTLIACFCRQPASSGVNPKTILVGFTGYRRQRLATSSRLPHGQGQWCETPSAPRLL